MRTTSTLVERTDAQLPKVSAKEVDDRGVFPNAAARDAILAIYDAKLATWPVPFEELDVRTTYGATHVIAAGRRDAPPLLLVHMAASSSFIWKPVIAPLASHYRAYAVDIIGDVNKSRLDDPARHPKTGDELGVWLGEVADALDIERSDVIAGSYGGWLAMHYATLMPERVRRLVLIVPMGLPTFVHTIRVLVRLLMIQLGLSASKMERTLSYLLGDDAASRELAGDWFTEIFTRKCRMRAPNPRPLSDRRLEALSMPTLVILGERDPLIGNAERAARRARVHIPHVEVEVVPAGTHSVHIEKPERVATRILEFLASHERASVPV
jgi:pimeloyl-ACP methyl ester carboxylesterase